MIKEIYKPTDLLELYFDLNHLTTCNNWNTAEFNQNAPRFCRYQQLESLCKAYNLGKPKNLVEGNFLHNITKMQDNAIRDYLRKDFKDMLNDEECHKMWNRRTNFVNYDSDDLVFIYNKLFKYREQLHNVVTVFSGVYATSDYFYYPIICSNKHNEKIFEIIADIDSKISVFISPENRIFTKAELIADFGFIDFDLYEIDADNL